MYSLGIVFFEVWHPFGTAMERHVILSDLKQKGELPPSWVAQFPEQASLLQRLMSPSPSDRPSATDLLKHAFPPRMESELLDSEYFFFFVFLCVCIHLLICVFENYMQYYCDGQVGFIVLTDEERETWRSW
jgi:serine/threonine protein kinase